MGIRDKKTVLKGVDFSLSPGEFVCLTGRSGGGKTTLIKILSGILSPSSGEIFYREKKLGFFNKGAFRKSFSFVFQDYKLIPHLTVFENVSLPLRLKNLPDLKAKTLEALDFCGIAPLSRRYPYQLSGGESQRASIARALTVKPEIIFADEPTGNLDQETEREILSVFQRLHQKFQISFVVVTHEPEIREMADRIYEICGGELFERAR